MAALFELDGVSKCFGLVDVGEALAVIGPNGARATDPVQPDHLRPRPETGRILFAVADITTLAPQARSRLGIGRTYQIPHPFANMTVFENLLVGAIFGARQSEREIYDRCAELLELD